MNENDNLNTKGQIFNAAKSLFARQGFFKTTVNKIGSKRSNKGEPSVYRLFGGKDGILLEIFEVSWRKIQLRVEESIKDETDVINKFTKVLGTVLDIFEEDPEMIAILLREARHERGPVITVAKAMKDFFDLLDRLFTEAIDQGFFRKDMNVKAALTATFGAVEGLLWYGWCSEGEATFPPKFYEPHSPYSRQDIEKTIVQLLEGFIDKDNQENRRYAQHSVVNDTSNRLEELKNALSSTIDKEIERIRTI